MEFVCFVSLYAVLEFFASQHKMIISVWPSFLVTSKVLYVFDLTKFSSHLKSLKLRKTSK